MAWIDDRLWCHPKIVPLTVPARWVYVAAIAYSSGMSTGGRIDAATQRLLGARAPIRAELLQAGLWDLNGDGTTVHIHDWDEHNSKRDERRKKDRERKRAMRASAGQGADK